MSYDFGVDVLGAGPTGSLTPLQQLMQIPPTQPSQMVATMPAASSAFDNVVSQVRPVQKQFDAQFEADKRLARNVFVGGVIGGTIGFLGLGVGGAYLWPAHRILGFVVGSMLGWPVGSTVGGTIGATT